MYIPQALRNAFVLLRSLGLMRKYLATGMIHFKQTGHDTKTTPLLLSKSLRCLCMVPYKSIAGSTVVASFYELRGNSIDLYYCLRKASSC